MQQKEPTIFLLMGPTATGKTNLAIELAQQLPCEIISVDSAMIYRGMNVGTGKPSLKILNHIPHQLVDICDPTAIYSAVQFCDAALVAIKRAILMQKIPLLVGGTMLYFHTLQFGMTPLPSADPILRQQLVEKIRREGLAKIHAYLEHIDPESAKRIHVNDPQRLIRAIEVYTMTGMTFSQHIRSKGKLALSYPYRIQPLALIPDDREKLKQVIAQRFNNMLKQGFIEEVNELRQNYVLHEDLPSMRAVGYRQIWQYLDNKMDFKTMTEQAIIATRQLAKRQLTWLRRWPNLAVFPSENNNLASLIRNLINTINDAGG